MSDFQYDGASAFRERCADCLGHIGVDCRCETDPDESDAPTLVHDPDGHALVLFVGGGSILVSDSKGVMPGDEAIVLGRTIVVSRLAVIEESRP